MMSWQIKVGMAAAALFATVTAAWGQMSGPPPPPPIPTVGLIAGRSEVVVLGTESDFESGKKPWEARQVTLAVQETLKGGVVSQVKFIVKVPEAVVVGWKNQRSRLLVGMTADGKGDAVVVDLSVAHLAVLTDDLTLLRRSDEVVNAVKGEIEALNGKTGVSLFGINLPVTAIEGTSLDTQVKNARYRYPTVQVITPVNQAAERWAVRAVRSENMAYRIQGVAALSHFKSATNAEHLKSLLNDPGYTVGMSAEDDKGTETREFPVRKAAYELLSHWDVAVKEPVTSEKSSRLEEVTTLRMWGGLSEEDMALIKRAKNLKSLDLSGTAFKATDEVVSFLGELTNLMELKLPGLTFEDRQLRFLPRLRHLEYFSVPLSRITDGGLKYLAGLPQLKRVNLDQTEVSDAGYDNFRRARPDVVLEPARPHSLFYFFVERNDVDGARQVLELTPEVINQLGVGGYQTTALHDAAIFEHGEMVKMLLKHGADVNAVNSAGETPLQFIAGIWREHTAICRTLIAAGADVNHRSKNGATALDVAIDRNMHNIARMLLANGADPKSYQHGLADFGEPDGESMKILEDAKAGRGLQAGMLLQTDARCDRVVYALRPGEGKPRNWGSRKLGRLTGPIQWSQSPKGVSYLGPFGQQAVTLRVGDLGPHKNVDVMVDLWVIGSWDGDGGLGSGPDIIDISVPNIGTLMHSTFFNNDEGDAHGLLMQSFPDPYLAGSHVGYTGATGIRSLGFTDIWDGHVNHRDAVYRLRYTFAHTAGDLEIVFSGLNVTEAGIKKLTDDENWGIGALTVKTDR